ncbi:hypothetical protein ABZ656_56235 [Streptomyces sp. NPDC007095]|uniref:hypothetical protein n=1 Tax=Streptomyces sp. NPDC007095 TaxID=3154482 RepID=UPI000C71153F
MTCDFTMHTTHWLAASPVDRLLPPPATWAVTPEVFSYWPDQDETPVAPISPQDPVAVPLRIGLLDALAHLPPGQGPGPGRGGSPGPEAVAQLLACAAWFQPVLTNPDQDTTARAAATLQEAELRGVTAHGTLTTTGHAVLVLLHAGAARHFPAVPGAGPGLGDHPDLLSKARALAKLNLRRIAPTVLISTATPDTTLTALRTAGSPLCWRPKPAPPSSNAPPTNAPQHHAVPRPGPQTAPELAAELLTTRRP